MKVLILGSGGREHALAWKCEQSKLVEKVFVAPGNGGTNNNVSLNINNHSEIIDFVKKEGIDLTIVGPEDPLVNGLVDKFKKENLVVFGPHQAAAALEGSKEFAKKFMFKHNVPTARYQKYSDLESALEGLNDFEYPLVIKADGLALGKGVKVCFTQSESKEFLNEIFVFKKFGEQTIIIEEFLEGTEASLLCIVSNNKLYPLESARDYKRIGEGNTGNNTGGVGCYSPSELFNNEFKQIIKDEILIPIEKGLKEDNLGYYGILFIGLMIDNNNPKVLEFNVRFGDPETEVIMPRLKSDLVDILLKSINQTLKQSDIIWNSEPCFGVVLTSKGYPAEYKKGFEIKGLDKIDALTFHNGTKKENDIIVTNGGRVLTVTSSTTKHIYDEIENISFDGMTYRKDIGYKF